MEKPEVDPAEHRWLVEENEEVLEEQRAIFSSMSVKEKMDVMGQLYFAALSTKEAHLKRLNPDWSDKKVAEEAKKWMLYARS